MEIKSQGVNKATIQYILVAIDAIIEDLLCDTPSNGHVTFNSDRFDDLPEDLEDNILNPIDPGPSVCVADQQGILEL